MKVTVILTSYNHEKYLRESIDSVLKQTYQNFELIIIDDCSSDSSWNIIEQYSDPRIKKIRNDVNTVWIIQEIIENYQIEGEYVAIHHSDDIWMEDKLQKQVEFLNSHTQYAGVFTEAEVVNEDGSDYRDTEGFYHDVFAAENRTRYEWLRYFFYQGNCLCHPSVMLRKEVYYKIKPFINGMYQIGDMMMWVLICQHYDIYVIQEKLVKFRIRNKEKNMSGMRVDSQIRSSVELFLMLHYYLNIREKEEFLKIFPEAEEYCVGEEFVPEYVMAQLCIHVEGQDYFKLFGIMLLFQLLNDTSKAKILKEQYLYDGKSFVKQTGEYDVFHVLPDGYKQTGTVYLSGADESELQIYRQFQYNYIMGVYNFCYEMDIEEPFHMLRFDPCEGISVKCKIDVADMDGEPLELKGINSAYSAEDGDIFVNKDPIYMVQVADGKKGRLVLKGQITRISDQEINDYIEKNIFSLKEYKADNESLYQNNSKLKNITSQLSEGNAQLKSEIEQSYQENDRLKSEMEKVCDKNNQLKIEAERLYEKQKYIEERNQRLRRKIEGLENERKILEEQNSQLKLEINALKSTKLYKVYKKCRELINRR